MESEIVIWNYVLQISFEQNVVLSQKNYFFSAVKKIEITST